MMAFIFDSLTILVVFTGFSIAAIFEVFVTCCYNCCCTKHHMQVPEDIYDDYETGGDNGGSRPKTGESRSVINDHQIQPTMNESNLNSLGHPPTPAQWWFGRNMKVWKINGKPMGIWNSFLFYFLLRFYDFLHLFFMISSPYHRVSIVINALDKNQMRTRL